MKFNHVYFETDSYRITPKGIVETNERGEERFWPLKRRNACRCFRYYAKLIRRNNGVLVRVGK